MTESWACDQEMDWYEVFVFKGAVKAFEYSDMAHWLWGLDWDTTVGRGHLFSCHWNPHKVDRYETFFILMGVASAGWLRPIDSAQMYYGLYDRWI